jgi:peptidoglycan hydrolase-like protein with peptidoglycan-binding domain
MKRFLVGIVTVSILVGVGGSMSGGLARPPRETTPPAPRFVREAQQALRELGYRPGPVDGIVGPRTKQAIVSYQRAERIQETGRLDTETMVRLDIQHRVLRPNERS